MRPGSLAVYSEVVSALPPGRLLCCMMSSFDKCTYWHFLCGHYLGHSMRPGSLAVYSEVVSALPPGRLLCCMMSSFDKCTYWHFLCGHYLGHSICTVPFDFMKHKSIHV